MLDLHFFLGVFLKTSNSFFLVGGLPRDYIFFLKSKKIKPEQFSTSFFRINFEDFLNFITKKTFCDIDIATVLTPKQVAQILDEHFPNSKRIRNFATNSISFQNAKIDITSTRIDYDCDGKNAKMKLGASIFRDSHRRDFTFNALYMNSQGNIFDFHNGIDDIYNNKIQFIGNTATRINEDFTRIKRYQKFCERFGMENPEIDYAIDYIIKNSKTPIIMR